MLKRDFCELIFVAKVLETNEVEKMNVNEKIDRLENQLDRVKDDIIASNSGKIEEIAIKILKGLDDDEDQDGGAALNKSRTQRYQNASSVSKQKTSIEAKKGEGRSVSGLVNSK